MFRSDEPKQHVRSLPTRRVSYAQIFGGDFRWRRLQRSRLSVGHILAGALAGSLIQPLKPRTKSFS
jgi:hypothetical protein